MIMLAGNGFRIITVEAGYKSVNPGKLRRDFLQRSLVIQHQRGAVIRYGIALRIDHMVLAIQPRRRVAEQSRRVAPDRAARAEP